MSSSDFPFKAEYAKSNRSSCKKCKDQIGKETLRLARMIQSPHFDGKMPQWYHFECFWTICRVSASNEIGGIDGLRWDDQVKIKDQIKGVDGKDGGKKGQKRAGDEDEKIHLLSDFAVEYAKSSRSKCRACEEKIMKDTVRISKRDMVMAIAKGVPGPLDLWHHMECFCKKDRLDELGWPSMGGANAIPGFDKLKPEDKKILEKNLGKGKSSSTGAGPAPKKAKESNKSKDTTTKAKASAGGNKMDAALKVSKGKAKANPKAKGAGKS